jgi:uncharacterized membrane protein YraQ (UPF0718 family)
MFFIFLSRDSLKKHDSNHIKIKMHPVLIIANTTNLKGRAMYGLYAVAAGALLVSFCMDREKTVQGIRKGTNKLVAILPGYLKLLILISVVFFISEPILVQYLGQENKLIGMATGLLLGSVTIMPGFIAYPLAGVLIQKGISYLVVASFVVSLMMVGVLTFPLEKSYLGARAALVRNGVSLVIAVIIALAIGLIYGELP